MTWTPLRMLTLPTLRALAIPTSLLLASAVFSACAGGEGEAVGSPVLKSVTQEGREILTSVDGQRFDRALVELAAAGELGPADYGIMKKLRRATTSIA